MSAPSITCPVCGRTSYNPHDIREGYCGHCHDWTSAAKDLIKKMPFDEVAAGMFFDRQGQPITLARWTWLVEGAWQPGHPAYGYKRIAHDDLADGVRVSTIWEGIAGLPWAEPSPRTIFASLIGEPLAIFETMVFIDGTPKHQARYTTEAEALATHRTLVKSLELVGRAFLDELDRTEDGEA